MPNPRSKRPIFPDPGRLPLLFTSLAGQFVFFFQLFVSQCDILAFIFIFLRPDDDPHQSGRHASKDNPFRANPGILCH